MTEILYSKIEGEGIPLIVMHGYMGMSDNWNTFGKQMAEIGYEVHLLDLRNHGRSFHSDDWSYDFMVEDIVRYMDHHAMCDAVVLGHSMGGKVAMKLATRYPAKVEKLIVADISPRSYAPHHQDILAALNAVDFSTKPSRKEVEEIIASHISEVGTRLFLMKSLYWVEPGQLGFRFNLNAFNKNEDVVGEGVEDGAEYTGNTLFIRGGNSKYIQEKDEVLIKEHFPNSIIKTIPNTGHWLHAENPQMFFDIVKEFLN
ncbi:alpha/beta fold hydrolase [Myroides marinus]|uniref:Pimeloyl-ACP methyl ester carboxylesterase n=1 Tax=Myroides marinus TaxID=703342 RepID=A0A1H6TD29_9FLAO|nr:alpha/beta fold hydrolase [Myroides marinus]MDM1378701.1 alpha/beta fold hydrolase [Myroides marinus]MDM1385972.1 alpha/beta fold hydrolase [Myroides marinus]MDM1393250.1 alpha/beta fold hydrolase [Myroides marinus]SEI77938.1 Pimeloyl-ACP methyl ester carboxylesterase [Myroides marinus]